MFIPPKHILRLIVATALLSPYSAFAGSPVKGSPTKVATVASVNLTANTISINNGATNTIKSGNQSHNIQLFKIGKFTAITVNGLKATLADVKTGMKVQVTIGMDHDVASTINAYGTPPPAPTPMQTSAAAAAKAKGGKDKGKSNVLVAGQVITEDKIVAIGKDSITIGEDGGKRLKAYKIGKITQIVINGQKSDPSALKVGMKVEFRIGMDPQTLESITVSD